MQQSLATARTVAPVRRILSLVPLSSILRQTGTELSGWAAPPPSVGPGAMKGDG